MVRMPARIRTLDRKLLRDLWAMKGQAAAIAAVMAAGVTMFVAYFSNFDSLLLARAAYYDNARFADVFASLTRAPSWLEERLAAIPGVDVVATRVVEDVTLDVPGMPEPATGRLISVPERGRPPLNDVFLRRGRWIDPGRPDEVLASELFCEEHGFEPGDRVAALINGRRRELTIVGISVGMGLGLFVALRPGSLRDTATNTASFIGLSIPPYVSAILLQILFAVYWSKWFGHTLLPASGIYPPGHRGTDLLLMAKHMVLPVIVATVSAAEFRAAHRV